MEKKIVKMNFSFLILLDILSLGFLSCNNNASSEIYDNNSSSEAVEHILPAPENFTASDRMNNTGWHSITFSFYPVEYAVNYMIYYSLQDNVSTAKPFLVVDTSPYRHQYKPTLKAYFWIRAYDGRNYGEWSNSIYTILD